MYDKDPRDYEMSRSEQTRAWYADQLLTFWGKLRGRPWAKILGTTGFHTVCAETEYGPRYALLDECEPYQGRKWSTMADYVQEMVQEQATNQFSYRNFVEDPDVRAWCRGVRHDGFEGELAFRIPVGHGHAPDAVLLVGAPTADFGHDLPDQGFVPYAGETWVLAF